MLAFEDYSLEHFMESALKQYAVSMTVAADYLIKNKLTR